MMVNGGTWGGMGAGGWVLMIGFWGALILAVLWMVTRLFPAGERRSEAREVLDRRLAAGEIDLQTYRAVRDQLGGAGRSE